MKRMFSIKHHLLVLISLTFIGCTNNSTITEQNSADFNMMLQGTDDSLIWVNNQLKFEIIQDSFVMDLKNFQFNDSVPTLYVIANLFNPSKDTISFTNYMCDWTSIFSTEEESKLYICSNICFIEGFGTTQIVPKKTKTYNIRIQKKDDNLRIGDTIKLSCTFSEPSTTPAAFNSPTTIWSNEIVVSA